MLEFMKINGTAGDEVLIKLQGRYQKVKRSDTRKTIEEDAKQLSLL